MSGEMTAAWQLLTAVARARQQLSSTRPLIWEKARLPTAEHAVIVKPADVGTSRAGTTGMAAEVVMRLTMEMQLQSGRRLTSCLDVVAAPNRWRARPYIEYGDGTGELVWQGEMVECGDLPDLVDSLDRATQALIAATLDLDFAALATG
jgi:hypothetical protein